jgi:hypothetical protein
MAVCEKCGEEDCAAKRAVFAREPYLAPGFEIGAQWTSPDGGLTWYRGDPPPPACIGRKDYMTVTGVDVMRGVVTIKVG